MSQAINIVQGFQGEIPYTLDVNNISLSKSTIYFIFSDRCKQKRHVILCNSGSKPNEIIIPFKISDTIDYGEFYGEVKIIHADGNIDLYPIAGCIILRIREGV